MSAQPIHEHQPVRIPKTVKGIRPHLPVEQQAVFDAELRDAADAGDLAAIVKFKDRWWGRAMFASDPSIRTDLDALRRGDLPLVPSPLAR